MKKIISGIAAISIFFTTGSAFVTYEIPIREEKIIPISFISDSDETLESIDLSEYEEVKIVDYGMTKGKAIYEIKDDELILLDKSIIHFIIVLISSGLILIYS